MAVPSLTRTIDDAFTHTWFEIRKKAIDNILSATPIVAALREMGCFKTQVGGEFITRTVSYGEKTAEDVTKTSTLPSGEDDIETMARYTWKYLAVHVQRSIMDDQKNNGPNKIKSLVTTKLNAARNALKQKTEGSMTNTESILETSNAVGGLMNIVPDNAGEAPATTYASTGTSTLGKIDKNNAWWRHQVKAGIAPMEVNLITSMNNIYNTCSGNFADEVPKLIITTQAIHELYAEFVQDKVQIVKDASTKLADLGFDVLRFRGKPLIWSSDITAGYMKFLNTDYIDVVYDPQLWFEMTEWKPIYNQPTRIAHIMCALETACSSLRRQGSLYLT